MTSLAETRDRDPLAALTTGSFGLGAVLALLGMLALAAPWVASTVIDYVVGGSLIAAGVSQLGMTALTFTWRGFWMTLICGVLSIVAGMAMLVIPVEGIHALVTFLGLVILFESVAKLTAAFSLPREFPRGWLFVDGVVTALLGAFLLVSSRDQAGVYLGVIVGINLLSSGLTLLASGIWMRRSLS